MSGYCPGMIPVLLTVTQGPQFRPAPSADAKSARAHDWMVEFEESGGLLDGILAVEHPELYAAAQDLMAKLSTAHAPSMFLMQTWPTSFTSVQVISNRQTPWHRDLSSKPGWLDLLLSLGSYGQDAVLEVRTLGISLPYDSGTVASLTSKLLLHGVPKVGRDRLCYALYLNKTIFESLNVPLPGMATSSHSHSRYTRQSSQFGNSAADAPAGGGSRTGRDRARRDAEGCINSTCSSSPQVKANNNAEAEQGDDCAPERGGCGSGDDSDGAESGGTGDADGSSSCAGGGSTTEEGHGVSDVEMVGTNQQRSGEMY